MTKRIETAPTVKLTLLSIITSAGVTIVLFLAGYDVLHRSAPAGSIVDGAADRYGLPAPGAGRSDSAVRRASSNEVSVSSR
jgi:hypothetical protein